MVILRKDSKNVTVRAKTNTELLKFLVKKLTQEKRRL